MSEDDFRKGVNIASIRGRVKACFQKNALQSGVEKRDLVIAVSRAENLPDDEIPVTVWGPTLVTLTKDSRDRRVEIRGIVKCDDWPVNKAEPNGAKNSKAMVSVNDGDDSVVFPDDDPLSADVNQVRIEGILLWPGEVTKIPSKKEGKPDIPRRALLVGVPVANAAGERKTPSVRVTVLGNKVDELTMNTGDWLRITGHITNSVFEKDGISRRSGEILVGFDEDSSIIIESSPPGPAPDSATDSPPPDSPSTDSPAADNPAAGDKTAAA